MLSGSHATQHEDLRRTDGPGAEYDLFAGADAQLPAVPSELDAAGSFRVVDEDLLDQRVRGYVQVRPHRHDVGQEGGKRAAPFAVPRRQLRNAEAFAKKKNNQTKENI